MALVLRTVLTWLLLLALPVQGIAASSMLGCGLAQHHPAAASPDHAAHPHEHAATGADEADAGAPGVQADGGALTQCSACTACCSSAAIAASPLVSDVVAFAPPYGAVPGKPHAGFSPSGLERPPRLFLA